MRALQEKEMTSLLIFFFFFSKLKTSVFILTAEIMWPLCLPYLPCFPGHLLHLHILQSARDQGQDF